MSNELEAHVARLFYFDKLNKREIAEKVGVSRFKVARLLDAAHSHGIVEVRIVHPSAERTDLARSLESTFALDLAVLCDRGDATSLGRAAAPLVAELAAQHSAVGVAWGRTLTAIAANLPQLELGTEVIQISGAIVGVDAGIGPAEVVIEFARRLGCTAYPLSAPAFPGTALSTQLASDETVAPVIRRWQPLPLAVVGIGVATALPSSVAPAVGHILVHSFDRDGHIITNEAERAIAMSTDELARTRVVAVAGGHDKIDALLGALRTGLLNILVVDIETAERVLAAHENQAGC